ncbi:MAG: 5-oxoprolinase subunit PxpB [Saprospiraceae bacterium]|nr:5-oxoprolinase subunit PxpB [Saprospiraceae bacterium]
MIQPKNIKPYGRYAALIEWEQIIDPEILQNILLLDYWIESLSEPSIIETVPAYASLTIFFKPDRITFDKIKELLFDFYYNVPEIHLKESNHWKIPVCYHFDLAPDYRDAEEITGLQFDEIVHLHSSASYLVYFIGFMPGFMYLGGLPSSLEMPRKITPRLSVPAGSVGIGGKQTGIYPQESPAGWQIIGRSPMQLFDYKKKHPCYVKSGDTVTFYEISLKEFRNGSY